MVDLEAAPDRGALIGTMISAAFGVVWTQWAASGLSGAVSGAIRVAGIVVGLVIFYWSARLSGRARPASRAASTAPPREGSRSTFSFLSPKYLLVVALEVVVIGGGGKLLNGAGHGDSVIAWAATVVGLHFLAFGRLFFAGFYWVGAALIAAGIAGAIVGFAGGSSGAIKATTGLIAAATLFVAGGWAVLRARDSTYI